MKLKGVYRSFLDRINKFSRRTKIILGAVILGLVILVTYQGFYFFRHRTVLSSLENPATVNLADFQKNEVLKEINELYSFEENADQAVIGKITNIDRLSSQHDFFKKAKNGDYLLVMPNFILIYDPTTKTVVDIARENLLDLKETPQ